VTSLIRAGAQTTYISLDLIEAHEKDSVELAPGDERVVVMLSGRAEVVIDGRSLGIAGRRTDVFEGPGDAVYVPPTSAAVLVAMDEAERTGFTAAVASAPAGPQAPGAARVIPGSTWPEVAVGRDSWARTVRTILGGDDQASRLIVGETVHTGTGSWSSFPPHRHDRDSPEEVRLEEVYYYRLEPAGGFAVQIRYDAETGEEDLRIVRDGDSAAITAGFHPVVAAPGYRLHYLWILAGERRQLLPYVDPRYRWLNEQP
jgi:5-deoxy-glucuronate isomerase